LYFDRVVILIPHPASAELEKTSPDKIASGTRNFLTLFMIFRLKY
jgi:hypothetical protein